jgi:hypothetical protein
LNVDFDRILTHVAVENQQNMQILCGFQERYPPKRAKNGLCERVGQSGKRFSSPKPALQVISHEGSAQLRIAAAPISHELPLASTRASSLH